MADKNYVLAIEAMKSGEYETALDLLNKAIADNANNADLYSERGVVYHHLKRNQEALREMEKALVLEPNNSYRYSTRAYIKNSIGDIEGAVRDYEKAVKLDPKDAIAYNNLGMMQERLGYVKSAKRNFEKADEIAESHDWNDLFKQDPKGNTVVKEEIQEPTSSIKEEQEEPDIASHKKVILDVFRKKDSFREFVRFIKKGFRN